MHSFLSLIQLNGVSQEKFAPHLACEILEKFDSDDEWPTWDDDKLLDEEVELVVQINGKLRARIAVPADQADDKEKLEEFAKNNDIKVIAEGVETREELVTMINFGVDLIQGYYTARPSTDVLAEIPEDKRKDIKDIIEAKEGSNERII